MFHVVASYRANPAMMAPSKRNCRIAQRIARTPTLNSEEPVLAGWMGYAKRESCLVA